MPSSSFVLGSGATFVTLLSLVAASPLTYAPAPTENAWDPWTSSSTTTKPVDPATSSWSDWDPATSTKKTTTSKPADPATSGWANWNDAGNDVSTTKGCGVGYSTYTTKPCWTVENKQTCTEVVKTTQYDLCSGKPTVPTSTAYDGDWSTWAACTPGTTTSVEKSCKQGGPCTAITKTITTSSCSGTTIKPNTATSTSGWVDWDNYVTSCSTTASTYTTKPCWTVDNKQTCTEVVKTTSVTGCTTTTKPNTATSTKPATTTGWNNWNGNNNNNNNNNNGNTDPAWNNWNGNGNSNANKETCGGVVTKTFSTCETPKATPVTSCTTYHMEKAPYTPTSSCTTYSAKESVGPVCATYVAALTYQCGTTQTCSTPVAQVTTTCSTKSVDPTTTWASWTTTTSKPADPATTWAEWGTTSASADGKKTTTTSAKNSVTSSCTTYHLEKAPYTAVTSCSTYTVPTTYKPGMPNPFVTECATVTAKVTPVCYGVPTTSTITSTITNYVSSKPVSPTTQCSTPAVSTVTNCKTIQTYTIPSVTGKPAPSSTCYAKGACSTYHLEVAPYTPTSSCFTTSTCEEVKETPKPGMPNPFATTCETTVVTPTPVCSTVWGDWSSNTATKTPDAATGTNWALWTAGASATGVQGVKAYTGAASTVEAGAFVMVAAAIVGGAALIL